MIPKRYFFQTSSTSMTVLIEEKWKFGKLKVEIPFSYFAPVRRESEKNKPSFVLPYGQARKRTRRIKSETL
jgi:hypothetical protein